MPALGPMVYRSVHVAAAFLVFGVAQFLVGMGLAQYLYPYSQYSLTQNDISDLGQPGSSAHGLVFNTSIGILGLCAILAAVLLRSAFPAKTSARLGLVGFALGGFFAVLVGRFPESSPYLSGHIHSLVAALTFFFSGFALVFLGLAMVRDTRWRRMRLYTFVSGLVTWIAMGLYIGGTYLGLGPGGMERLIVAPALLWGLVAGFHLWSIPRFRPEAVRDWSAPGAT